jgi:K+-sensing histidine kinase KdpD
LGVGALAAWLVAHRDLGLRQQKILGFAALALDTMVVASYVVIYYAYEPDTPVRQIMMLPVVEAAVRYGILGGVLLPLALAPFLAIAEVLRADRYDRSFSADAITLPLGIEILVGLIVGWLAARLRREAQTAEARAAEAEELRDRLGRRADQLEAVNRVAAARLVRWGARSSRTSSRAARRSCAASLRPARRLRLAGLPRAPRAHGGGHRLCLDAPGALARALG